MLSMSMGNKNTQTTIKPIIIPIGLFSIPNKENGSRTCTDQEIFQIKSLQVSAVNNSTKNTSKKYQNLPRNSSPLDGALELVNQRCDEGLLHNLHVFSLPT